MITLNYNLKIFFSEKNKLNVNKIKPKVSNAARKELEHRMALDLEFYKFIKERFIKQKEIFLK